jgi:predicted MPP superfamily phosphohydrolase
MSEGETRGNGPAYGILQLIVFLSAVFAVICLLGWIIASMAYALYGGPPYLAYIGIAMLSGIIIIGSMMVSNRWHHRFLSPLYLASMLMLASYLYAFAVSLIISLVLLAGLIIGVMDHILPIARIAFPLLVLGPIAYGLIESRVLRTKRIELRTNRRLKRDLTVVYFSDVHIGLVVGRSRLSKIVRIAKEARPDAIMIGGDLYDTGPENVRWSEPLLRSLSGSAPTFMVTGNHEFFHGVEKCISTLSGMGIRTLRGSMVNVPGAPIAIGGLDDPSDMPAARTAAPPIPSPDPDPSVYKIFAYHRPQRFSEAVKAGYDLEICGHTHWGQLVPFNLATYLAWGKTYKGLHRKNGSYLYTSSGAGTWGPPVRVFAPPEVVIIKVHSG